MTPHRTNHNTGTTRNNFHYLSLCDDIQEGEEAGSFVAFVSKDTFKSVVEYSPFLIFIEILHQFAANSVRKSLGKPRWAGKPTYVPAQIKSLQFDSPNYMLDLNLQSKLHQGGGFYHVYINGIDYRLHQKIFIAEVLVMRYNTSGFQEISQKGVAQTLPAGMANRCHGFA